MNVNVEILAEADDWKLFDWLRDATQLAANATFSAAGVTPALDSEISLLLCDDDRIRELNAQWRSIDKPTNVLSFPAADPDELEIATLLGDIAISFTTVAREAQNEGKTFQAHYTHLIVHGVLHLLGFDHEQDDEAEEMEAMERKILSNLGIADPYEDLEQEPRRP